MENVMLPEEVRLSATENVSAAVVVILPALETVKLLILVSEPIANAVVPLFNVTLFTAPLAVEPVTANAPTAFVPVRFTVEVWLTVEFANVTFKLEAVIAPLPLIT